MITEICYGTTTESLIRSIDEAAKREKSRSKRSMIIQQKKWKLKLSCPVGNMLKILLDALYAYTECEVSLTFSNGRH